MQNIKKEVRKVQKEFQQSQRKVFHKSNTKLVQFQFQQQNKPKKGIELGAQEQEGNNQGIYLNLARLKRVLTKPVILYCLEKHFKSIQQEMEELLQEKGLKVPTQIGEVQIKQSKLPFASDKMTFIELYNLQVQKIEDIDELNYRLERQIGDLSCHMQSEINPANPQQMNTRQQYQYYVTSSRRMETMIQIEKMDKWNTQTCLTVLNQEKLNKLSVLKKLNQQIQYAQLKQKLVKERLRRVSHLGRQLLDQQNSLKNKIHADKFETAIIKLQQTDTLYRYGGKVSWDDSKRKEAFNANIVRWEQKIKSIDELDLRIFVLAGMYPMLAAVFDDFSAQANVFKVMFNEMTEMEQKDQSASLMILRNRIEKYYTNKKYSSLQACLNSNVKLKKRKIILVCSQKRLKQILDELLEGIRSFSNKIIQDPNAQIHTVEKPYEGTVFQHKKLTIHYTYDQVKTNVTFDVLYSTFGQITKSQIEILRKKSGKSEPVFCWIQYSKLVEKQKVQQYKELHLMLNKFKYFNLLKDREWRENR